MRAEDQADTPQGHLRDNTAWRRRARLIQAPFHPRTIDSKPSHFGFDYCADDRSGAANGEPAVAIRLLFAASARLSYAFT
jgi:hypothetical protein